MKKIFLLLILLGFPTVLLGANLKYQSYYAQVESITDGDTIKIVNNTGTESIRILGLDTPEIFTTRFGYSECYGKEASQYLKNYLTGGTQIFIESYGKDKYNRVLADVYIGSKTGSLIAKEMIQRGYGWTYKKGIKTRNYVGLIRAEKRAIQTKIGLWDKNNCNGERRFVPEDTANKNPEIDQKQEIFSCKKIPRYCSNVKSRAEAQFYLHSCGVTRFDMDNDDIACEDIP